MLNQAGRASKTRPRYNETGHAHELTFSCYRRLPLLSQDRSRQWFVEALDRSRNRWQFDLWAYVIMPEHVHVLLRPRLPEYEISAILKGIKLSVSRRAIRFLRDSAPHWLERLKVTWPNGRVEHRFWQQGGGYDRNIISEKAALASATYIHANPVRRGLVRVPADWLWSSARWYERMDNVALEMDGITF